jgi:hypothetical protein
MSRQIQCKRSKCRDGLASRCDGEALWEALAISIGVHYGLVVTGWDRLNARKLVDHGK